MTIVQFPVRDMWIPDIDQVETSGQVILDVAGQSLDYFPFEAETRGTPYGRRVLTTGEPPVFIPNQDGQLIVTCVKLGLGRAGEERFQFDKGTLGTYAQKFLQFGVYVARTSPTPTGGISPRMQKADDLQDKAALLWTDAWIVWSALQALAQGGLKDAESGQQLTCAPISQDNVLVSPAAFVAPQGGLAVVRIEVTVQL